MREEALLWLKQARRDLRKALNDLKTEDWDSAAFWSQQASEKALKALLIAYGKMHRTHNLLELGEIVKQELKLDADEVWEDLRELTIQSERR